MGNTPVPEVTITTKEIREAQNFTTTMSKTPCSCLQNLKELLPYAPCEAAKLGLKKEVRSYLNDGGDINATTLGERDIPEGLTLLAAACIWGQSEMVECLVTHPSIHLNTRHHLEYAKECTPLWLAAYHGHDECVNILLTSNTKCHINPGTVAVTKEGEHEHLTPVMAAIKMKHWSIVEVLSHSLTSLSQKEVAFIMEEAGRNCQWDSVKNIINKNLFLSAEICSSFLISAYENSKWDIVCSFLKQNIRHKNDLVCEILSKTVEARDWDRVKYVISVLDKDLKLDVDMVKAALAENYDEMTSFLHKSDDETLDGVRLAVAAGGTSDEVAYQLYYKYDSGRRCVWESCLYLAAMNDRLEILPHIIYRHRKALTYSILSRARSRAAKEKLQDAERIVEVALIAKAKYFCT